MNGWEFATVVVVCLTVIIVASVIAAVQRAAYNLDEKPRRRKVRPNESGPTLGRHPQGTRGVLKRPDEMGMG